MASQPALKIDNQIVLIPRVRIRPFKDQPRTYFDPDALEELANSISEVGQLTPVLVRRIDGDPEHDYQLIAGQRRWHACEAAGVALMRAEIKDVKSEEEAYLLSAVENFARLDLSDIETARTLKKVRDQQNWTADRLARAFGRTRSWVTQRLQLLTLHPGVQAMMEPRPGVPENQRITFSFALRLAGIRRDLQLDIARTVIERGMKLNQATAFLKRKMEDVGETGPDHRPPPRKAYSRVISILGGLSADLESFLQIVTDKDVQAMVRYRPEEDRQKLMAAIAAARENLDTLETAIKKALGPHR